MVKFSEYEKERINWKVFFPKISKRRAIPFKLKFEIQNRTAYSLKIEVHIESHSQSLMFKFITSKKIGRDRIKEIETTMLATIGHTINGGLKKEYIFHGVYQPRIITRTEQLVLQYVISVSDIADWLIARYGPYILKLG